MERDRWIAGLAALTMLSALLGVLTMTAVRGPVRPERSDAPPAVRAVCMAGALICSAPDMPTGYPCTCADPLHGPVSGVVVPSSEAARLVERLRSRPDPTAQGERLLDR